MTVRITTLHKYCILKFLMNACLDNFSNIAPTRKSIPNRSDTNLPNEIPILNYKSIVRVYDGNLIFLYDEYFTYSIFMGNCQFSY